MEKPVTTGARVVPHYQLQAIKLLSGYLNDIEDWLDLNMAQLALLGVLVHPKTTSHRIARVFNTFLVASQSPPNGDSNRVPLILARQMLLEQRPIPELEALTEAEKGLVIKVVNIEFNAMLYALDHNLDYAAAFQLLNPGSAVFPSQVIWFKHACSTTGDTQPHIVPCDTQPHIVPCDTQPHIVPCEAECLEFDQLMETTNQDLQQKFAIDIKLYHEYLKQMHCGQ